MHVRLNDVLRDALAERYSPSKPSSSSSSTSSTSPTYSWHDGVPPEARESLMDRFWTASCDVYASSLSSYRTTTPGGGENASANATPTPADRSGTARGEGTAVTTTSSSSLPRSSTASSSRSSRADGGWDLRAFLDWSDRSGLGDPGVLDAVFHRLFGTGVLPTPAMERDLAREAWEEWTHAFLEEERVDEDGDRNGDGDDAGGSDGYPGDGGDGGGASPPAIPPPVWGGMGGMDGRGPLGRGVLYCVPRGWWDGWASYSGWTSAADPETGAGAGAGKPPSGPLGPARSPRPRELSTQSLLEPSGSGSFSGGTTGSYETMRPDLVRDVDYALVPPGVWDLLYELYGGGPALPRMVLPPETSLGGVDVHVYDDDDGGDRTERPRKDVVLPAPRSVSCADEDSVEVVSEYVDRPLAGRRLPRLPPTPTAAAAGRGKKGKGGGDGGGDGGGGDGGGHRRAPPPPRRTIPRPLPSSLAVAVRPWTVHCHSCDPRQPYRRGEAGPVSVRIMCHPDQPLWRLLTEMTARLPITHPKAGDGTGYGQCRLWRRTETTAATNQGTGAALVSTPAPLPPKTLETTTLPPTPRITTTRPPSTRLPTPRPPHRK